MKYHELPAEIDKCKTKLAAILRVIEDFNERGGAASVHTSYGNRASIPRESLEVVLEEQRKDLEVRLAELSQKHQTLLDISEGLLK